MYTVFDLRLTLREKAMAAHSGTLARKIPWTEEPGGLQSMGSLSWTQLSDFTFTFHFHALEKEMATHSSVLAWRIPGPGEPGGQPSMGSHRVGHDWSDLAAAAAAADINSKFKLKANPIKVANFSHNIHKPDFKTNCLPLPQLFTEYMALVNFSYMNSKLSKS